MTREFPAESASYEIYNLIPGRTYYCKVTTDNGQKTLASFSFNTTGQMRHLKAEGTANVRDLGGWPTESGRTVKYGMIFRGGEWNGGHNLEPEGIEALRLAGIKAELDLRSDSEARSITSSVLGSGVAYKRTPLGQTQSHMEGLTNSKATYKTALQYVLTCVKNDRPVYFHCAIGRDRTGTLAFLLEGVLGMSKSDIYKDYELTNFSYWGTPCSKGQLDDMFATIETLEQKFRAYLISYFGITGTAIDQFREKMLTTDDEDEIQTVRAATDNGQLYDLQGRRIANPSKSGIYIMNGKKVLIPFRTNR